MVHHHHIVNDMTYVQLQKQFMGQESNLTIELHVPPLYIIDDHVIDDRNDITISSNGVAIVVLFGRRKRIQFFVFC